MQSSGEHAPRGTGCGLPSDPAEQQTPSSFIRAGNAGGGIHSEGSEQQSHPTGRDRSQRCVRALLSAWKKRARLSLNQARGSASLLHAFRKGSLQLLRRAECRFLPTGENRANTY